MQTRCLKWTLDRVVLTGRPLASARPMVGKRATEGAALHLARAATNGAGTVAPPDIKELARMAHINVTDKEVADWEPKIGSIVEWFGQLQAVNTAGVKPAIHAVESGNRLRPDTAAVFGARGELMAAAPAMQDVYVKVPKIATAADAPAAPAGSAAAPSSSGSAAAPAAPAAPAGDLNLAAVQSLEIRVGKILECEKHPDADSLYVEKIDVGEGEARTIVSGLVKYVPLEAMVGRRVMVLCNLKARNMRGIKSHGMLLAASNEEHTEVEPLAPPEGAAVGERVWFGEANAQQAAPLAPNSVEKKKVWDTVQPLMRTDGTCVAAYGGLPMLTSAGPVKSATLASARIA